MKMKNPPTGTAKHAGPAKKTCDHNRKCRRHPKILDGMLLLKESTASSGNKAIAIGLIGGPIGIAAWSVGEAAAGAIAARLHDSGIHNDQLRQVGEELTSGSSALVLVIESQWTTAIKKDLVASVTRLHHRDGGRDRCAISNNCRSAAN
jgi:hypothetical protein